jgi:hypothetical protein
MLIPVLILAAGMSAGAVAGARWLPDLAPGSVGGLAFFVVCGLIGAAVGLVGLHIYEIVEELNRLTQGEIGRGYVVAGGLQSIAFEVGSLLAFASAVYLLAPASEQGVEPEAEPVT